MNCKMTSTANLNENEIILFILGDEKKESIQAIAIKDHVSTEIYLKDNVKVKHLQNSIKNKRIITFNGTSYDLPLLQKNNFKLEKRSIWICIIFISRMFIQISNDILWKAF